MAKLQNEIRISDMQPNSIALLHADRDQFELDPDYQRISDVWTKNKKQVLIDSLLNGFDIPKIYLYELNPPKRKGERVYRYAIVDGKQRLEAIWIFMNDDLPLDDDFAYYRDDTVKAGGMTYSELGEKYPNLKLRFDATPLSIKVIYAPDVELIEDMFSRLNEAVPLNAPEKRNALGGPLPPVIRNLANHDLFKTDVPFTDARYRHRDLAAKFLLLTEGDKVANTKKTNMDDMVKRFRAWRDQADPRASLESVSTLQGRVESIMDDLAKAFTKSDPLLRQVGMITLYFHLFRIRKNEGVDPMTRSMFATFEIARKDNKVAAGLSR